ncbi:transposase-like protein [Rhodococcus sp. 27YEA15]
MHVACADALPNPATHGFPARRPPKIGDIREYLRRAADQDGNILDVRVRPRRNAKAARCFCRKLMRKQARAPRVLTTDKLTSYVVAHRELMPSVEYRRSKYLTNRAENSHQPTRQRARAMKFFHSPRTAQRFLAVFQCNFAALSARPTHAHRERLRSDMTRRFATWHDVTGVPGGA